MILRRGDKGSLVKQLQKCLGFNDHSQDGDFGKMTEIAVTCTQENHGIIQDGIAGSNFFRKTGFVIEVFTPRVTEEMIVCASGRCPAKGYSTIVRQLNNQLMIFNMEAEHIVHFLSQLGHESAFKIVAENLNYSKSTFKRINKASLARFARDPEATGNNMYANRMGNGSVSSGDGFKYRGRGLIQITGRNNYTTITKIYNKMYPNEASVDFVKNPDSLLTQKYAVASALIWWKMNGINRLIDRGGKTSDAVVRKVTKRVNGGYNGLQDRIDKYFEVKKVMDEINK